MNNVLVKENVEADEKLINNMYDEIANCTFVNDVKQNFYKK